MTTRPFKLVCSLFLLVFVLGAPPLMARMIDVPVKVRLVGKPKPAVAGEPFSAGVLVSVAAESELSNFRIEDRLL